MASTAPRLTVCLLVASLALTSYAPSVRADEPAAPSGEPRLHWNSEWPYFRPIGYVLTAASILGALGTTFLIDYPNEAHWKGGILFDGALRDLLRARNPGARDAIRTASDITLLSNILQTGLVDGALIPLLDRSPGVAAQLSLINAQAFALDILIATILFKAVARERPLIPDCRRDPGFDPLCKTGAYAGFPSSHSSTAFTAAGLTCVHHAYLPLYGHKTWDAAACVESVVLASATGLFRVIGDRHYATDVLIGAAIGFSIGYIYPWLLHYRYGSDVPGSSEQRSTSGTFSLLPLPNGLGLTGSF